MKVFPLTNNGMISRSSAPSLSNDKSNRFITGYEENANNYYNNNNDIAGLGMESIEELNSLRFYRSINFCLTSIISVSILLSIIFITLVWITTFAASVVTLANSNRNHEFNKLQTYLIQSIKEIDNLGVTMSKTLSLDLNYTNLLRTENQMFKIYKGEEINHPTMLATIYCGLENGDSMGIINYNGVVSMIWVVNRKDFWYECYNHTKTEYCVRKPYEKPDAVVPANGTYYVGKFAFENFGKIAWMPSYTDAAIPGTVFMTLTTSFYTVANNNQKVWFAYDITTNTFSSFLAESTHNLPGATVFVLETGSEFFIASNVKSNSPPSDGSRETGLTFGHSNVKTISRLIYNRFQKLSQIPCNQLFSVADTLQYINLVRICQDNKLDWVLVLGVSQWYYIGNVVIAAVIAVFASVVIIVIGVFLGILVSRKILAPFNQLQELFQKVSEMDLDDIKPKKSYFSEVQFIQFVFNNMVARMKLYRSFIPGFLLMQIDEKMFVDNNVTKDDTVMSEGSNSAALRTSTENVAPPLESFASSMLLRKGSSLQRFEIGLEKKDITILGIRITSLVNWNELDCETIVKMTSDVYKIVNQVSKSSKGQVGNFDGDVLTLTFNGAISQSNHQIRACNAAAQLTSKLNGLNQKQFVSNFLITVISEIVACGNLGTEEVKSFTIIGSVHHLIEKYLEINQKYNVSITMNRNVQEFTDELFSSRVIDIISFKEEDVEVFELGESLSVEMDEWMYEMKQSESKNKWEDYNKAYKLYKEGKYSEAIVRFKDCLMNHENDLIVKKMLLQCQEQLHE